MILEALAVGMMIVVALFMMITVTLATIGVVKMNVALLEAAVMTEIALASPP
jgi:hypothetical protein